MPREIKVAAIQLDGAPAPTHERLDHAETFIADAAQQGAQLVVMPAQFNTGKTFLETTYEVTEPLAGTTLNWLCEQAQQHNIHIATTLVIVDYDDTYNAAFLIAPDGTSWRYDQQYPQMWERVFYRDGHSITVADTSLGKIGFIVGWDAAHPDLWERYAAKVDLLLVMHSDLEYDQAKLVFPDGSSFHKDKLGVGTRLLIESTADYLVQDVPAQSKWLQIPTITVGACGTFESILPAPYFSVQALALGNSDLWLRAESQYADIKLQVPFQQQTVIRDAQGGTIVSADDYKESVVVATLELPDKTPLPLDKPQPQMHTSGIVRLVIDSIANGLLTLNYRRGVRRQWGARMAPIDSRTKVWLQVLLVVAVLSAIAGRWVLPKRK